MSLPPDFHFLSIGEIAALLKSGETTAVELTQSIIERIKAKDAKLNAFISVTEDLALRQAARADEELKAGRVRGPLHGVPVAVKDLVVTNGIPTTFASRAYQNYVTDYDATVVTRLAEAGAVLVGKTNLSEGAADSSSQSSAFGAPLNPWNTDYITGGSSGGSASAVAAGLAYGAIGSDTVMSIRQPAAFCGIVGLKPTFGRVPKHGAMTLSFSLDHLGPMTRTVRDAAIMLQALAGPDPNDPTSADTAVSDYEAALSENIEGARLAVMRPAHFAPADGQWREAAERALATFESLGAKVEEVELPHLDDLILAAVTLMTIEASAFHAGRYNADPAAFGSWLRRLIEAGQLYSGVQYVQAQRIRRSASEKFLAAFAGFDALVLPTTAVPARRIGEEDDPKLMGERLRNTMPFNAVGIPAISVPAGLDDRGLPIGLQLVGQPFAEARLLQLAHAYEQASGCGSGHPET